MAKQKLCLGLSGGVDSAVALYLLQTGKQYHLVPCFMQNWESALHHLPSSPRTCHWQGDFQDAQTVCRILKTELYSLNFVKKYYEQVFLPFLAEYKLGFTPNPDVWCNHFIKFSVLFETASAKWDCALIATGHYAQLKINRTTGLHELHEAKDKNKDQTYFLAQLTQQQLQKIIFPLGHYLKSEVRHLAYERGLLPVAFKKDSTGICFIGERHFKTFLAQYLPIKKGDVVDITTNNVLKEHDGVYFYTIGQKKQLGLGGYKVSYFVVGKNVTTNILYVAPHSDNLYLQSDEAHIEALNWNTYRLSPFEKNHLAVKFRHRQPQVMCTIIGEKPHAITIRYPSQRAVTPGQHAVFYCGTKCLGGGIVRLLFYKKKAMWWINNNHQPV